MEKNNNKIKRAKSATIKINTNNKKQNKKKEINPVLKLNKIKIKINRILILIKTAEKENDFDNLIKFQDKLKKLRKKEEKLLFKNIQLNHKKEEFYFKNKYQNLFNTFQQNKEKTNKRFQKHLNEMNDNFKKHQRLEIKNFNTRFHNEYPKEPSIKLEILSIQDKINYFLSIKDYKNASLLNNQLEEYKIKKHEEYIQKQKKEYNNALNRLKFFQKQEKNNHDKKLNELKWENNYRQNNELKIFNNNRDVKYNNLRKIHNDELNFFKNKIYENNLKEGIKVSNRVKKINYNH